MRRLKLIAMLLSMLAVAGLLVFALARNGFRKQTAAADKSHSKDPEGTKARGDVVLTCPGRVEG